MTNRSPASVLLLSLVTLGLYGLVWYPSTRNEMVARGADIPPFWHMIVPILGLIWTWKYCQGVEKVTNGSTSATMAFILLVFLGPIGGAVIQGAFNKVTD